LQPSPSVRFPSSHTSPESKTKFPQASTIQSALHPSQAHRFPSSHSSTHSTNPFPHDSNTHWAVHQSPFTEFPSSHCSPSHTWRSPSPQYSTSHNTLQPSHGLRLESSHASDHALNIVQALSITLIPSQLVDQSPQYSIWHSSSQPSLSSKLPSSQAS